MSNFSYPFPGGRAVKGNYLHHEEHGEHEVLKGNSELTHRVIGAAIDVHKVLGPGLLEATYQQCLEHECSLRKICFQLEYPLPVEDKGAHLDCGYRINY